jgi:hypothetical protein
MITHVACSVNDFLTTIYSPTIYYQRFVAMIINDFYTNDFPINDLFNNDFYTNDFFVNDLFI